MFKTALFIIGKTWRPPKCPSTDEWIKIMQYTYTVEYYLVIKKKNEILPFVILLGHKKKNEILPFVTTWTDFKGIC